MKDILSLSRERFSARKFTSEAVSQEDLEYIMECVRLAPSACNKQPWHWLIVRSDEAKLQLQEAYDRPWFKTAPMYVVGMKNVEENWVRKYDEKPHGDIDPAIVRQHFHREGFEPVVIVPVGHIADDCPRGEKKRKAMEEIVEEV